MAKYKLAPVGVLDTETGAVIPNAEGNRHWKGYQAWLAEGNIPDPIMTPQELIDKKAADDLALLVQDVAKIDRALLRLIIRLYQALAGKGVINKADVGEAYIDGALALRDKLDVVEANE